MTLEEFRKAIAAPFERFEESETRRFNELMAIFDRIEARLASVVAADVADGSTRPHQAAGFGDEQNC